MKAERTTTAAYKRRNGFELSKAKLDRFKRSKYGIRTHTSDGTAYHRFFVDVEERDRVYAMVRHREHRERFLKHDKVLRNREGIVTFQCSY